MNDKIRDFTFHIPNNTTDQYIIYKNQNNRTKYKQKIENPPLKYLTKTE